MKKILTILALSLTALVIPMQAAKTKKTEKKAAKVAPTKKKENKKAEKRAHQAKKSKLETNKLVPATMLAKKFNPAHARDEVVGKTADGKQVFEGSHKGHYYLDNKGNKEYVKNFVGANIVGKTKDGRDIYVGPRGGHFYYTASGNKEYVKRA